MSLKMEQGFQEYPVLRDIIEMVEEGYVNRVPKHHFPAARSPIFDPKGSAIYITSWADFMKMASTDVQQIFRHRHILVTNTPVTPLNFDEEGLSTLGPLHQKCVFQGESCIALQVNLLIHLLQLQRCTKTQTLTSSILECLMTFWSQCGMRENVAF